MNPDPNPSLIQRLATMPREARRAAIAALAPADAEALLWHWPIWARVDQLAPGGDWRNWLLLAGRGAGKTRAACEWLRDEIESGRRRCMLIAAPTHLAGRKVLIEGGSGILACCPPTFRPVYEMAIGKLVWPNGGEAHLVSSESPERVRGFNADGAICDELVAWQDPDEFWTQIQLAMRVRGPLGHYPRIALATTPKPIPALKAIIADPGTVITRATTFDNRANLSQEALAALEHRWGGTSLGRQELLGELLTDVDESLWKRDWIDRARVGQAPGLVRVVVAIDPAVSSGAGSAETGIIAAGKDEAGACYVLADYTTRGSPETWARRALAAYEAHEADCIVAEVNQGGALVASVLQSVGFAGKLRTVSASRGKATRAEPIAALAEQGRLRHVGAFPALEDQLCGWVPGEGASPDRLDALVWAVTELALGTKRAEPAWLTAARAWKPPV